MCVHEAACRHDRRRRPWCLADHCLASRPNDPRPVSLLGREVMSAVARRSPCPTKRLFSKSLSWNTELICALACMACRSNALACEAADNKDASIEDVMIR